ncbi:MAG: hypothetical protein GX971_05045 [Firmicutes bacterium]|nr:hypothetical protein [Bacillota bacterium]
MKKLLIISSFFFLILNSTHAQQQDSSLIKKNFSSGDYLIKGSKLYNSSLALALTGISFFYLASNPNNRDNSLELGIGKIASAGSLICYVFAIQNIYKAGQKLNEEKIGLNFYGSTMGLCYKF